ncbi:DUF2798 domain-containing protein [Aliivibrio fischeri]|uniref:DUF2798 domain-containing protein n=1 Tax=Aliivibrio fischeri TaxID=668 RepID=UPI003CC80431
MAFLMTLMVSLTITMINLGFSEFFFTVWLKSWILSFSIAFFVVLLISPRVLHLVNRVIQ